MPAKILKKRFLDRITKRISNASREFQIDNGFELVERTNFEDDQSVNPLTDETMNFMEADPINHNFKTKLTTFSAEFTIIQEIDILRQLAGSFPVGTMLVVVNSAELEDKGFTIDQFESAIGVNIIQPVDVDQYGVSQTSRLGFHNIKSVTPNYIKERLIEVVLQVDIGDNDVSD